VIRTRVGYTGAEQLNPTYHELGGHSEALQVDFDPEVVSYGDLLAIFWKAHNPASEAWSAQYKAAIFYHDEEQQRLAVETSARVERELGQPVVTEILPASPFYRAEAYHQKYRLRRHAEWLRQLELVYPDPAAFTDSTAAARLNGHLAGFEIAQDPRGLLAPVTGDSG
jgi:peptide-methionine (S)-S-oxide reductase